MELKTVINTNEVAGVDGMSESLAGQVKEAVCDGSTGNS